MMCFTLRQSSLASHFLFGLFALTACNPKPSTEKVAPPPAVTVAPVHELELVEWNELTGRTAAIEFVEVRPRVSGHIQEVRFTPGQLVKRGDVLFIIDPRWHRAEMDRRIAESQQAKVRAENAAREAGRTEQLIASKAISKEEAEGREARFQEAKAGALAAEAALHVARLDLDHTEVRAPIDGRISRELVTAGNYVSGLAGAATVLATIASVGPIHVYADVDENALLRFNALVRERRVVLDQDGKVPVELQLTDEKGFPHQGVIESFDNKLDPGTGSILLRSIFPNTDGRIVPGLFARIRIPGSAKYKALLVDERAIGTDLAEKFVLVLTSTNTVEYRPVKIGPAVNGERIVRSGLKPGEKIVVNGLQRARPGMPVTPLEAVAAAAAPSESAEH